MLNLLVCFSLFIPALVAVIIYILPREYMNSWYLGLGALVASFLSLLVALVEIVRSAAGAPNYISNGFLWSQTWSYSVAFQFNYLTITIIMIVSLLFLLAFTLSRFELEQDNSKLIAILIQASCILSAIASHNLFFFSFFSMASLLPTAALIGWDEHESRGNTLKYFISCNFLADLLFILVSLYSNTKFQNDIGAWFRIELGEYVVLPNTLAFVLFSFAVLIKLGIFPMHFYRFELYDQKKLETIIPTLTGSGLGFVALLNFSPNLFAIEINTYAVAMSIFGLISVFFAGVSLLRIEGSRQRIMNLHLLMSGMIVMGFSGLNKISWSGAWLMAIFQILIIGMLISLVVVSERRTSAFKMSELGRAPIYAVQSAYASIAAYGLPISVGFYAFIFIFWGGLQSMPKIFGFALLCVPVLALSSIKMIFFKIRGGGLVGVSSSTQQFQDTDRLETLSILPLFTILLILGVYPALITDLIAVAVDLLLLPVVSVGR